ncbi:MAG TPA: PilC/PilY family type IV pilus protein [Casimicrobiaceae bacterium]|nr:PilC/PilY family type IV pilus protein [Casimicrobiaceae bacterium]
MMRMLASILTWALVAGQVMQPVHAVLTPLNDQPIAAKVSAKPNIVYTLDDSGSMQLNYIPEFTVSTAPAVSISAISRVGALATATVASTAALFTGEYINILGANQPEYNGQFAITVISGTKFTFTVAGAPITPATGTITYTVGSAYCRSGNNTTGCSVTLQGNNSFTSPAFFAGDFNRMMYNPYVTYYPPLKADGTPVTIAGVTDANGNMGTTVALYAGVQRDVYLQMFAAGVKDNLQTRVSVPLYCNTDWPLTAATNLAITDVGSNQGQYAAGTGGWCRINGTKYDLSAASGAPAVLDDYNYPYQSSSGATGPQYFYRTLSNKILWCDQSSPYWPRNPNVVIGCTLGGTITGGVAQTQTCVANGNRCNPTVALRNYTPNAAPDFCKTDPPAKFCAPGVKSSDSFSPGTGSAPECISCTCNLDTPPASPGHCSVNTGTNCPVVCGAAGCSASCPNIPATTGTGCSAGVPIYQKATALCSGTNYGSNQSGLLWDPTASAPSATTLLADSNGAGVVCRHNNQTYAIGGIAGLFKYNGTTYPGDVDPLNKDGHTVNGIVFSQTGAFTTQVTSSCPTVGTTIAIPRHYYTVDSVQFCDNRIVTPDHQWRGFGTGTCQAKNDLTQYKNVKYGQFHRWDLYAVAAGASPTYNPATVYPGGRVWLAASPTPANSESVNYANWYAGYATRLNAAKTTSGIAFSFLTPQGTDPIGYRVGFQNLGEELPPEGGGTPVIWVNVKDWDLAQRTAWYSALYGIKVNAFKTPILSAMLRVGNLFEKGGPGGGDPKVNPLPATAVDPIAVDNSGAQISCQNNYHILFTDGYTNQIAPTTTAGERDQTLPAWPWAGITETPPDRVVTNLHGGPWPRPFQQGLPAVSNTLADVAAYYWTRDLRDGTFGAALKNDVPSSSGNNNGDLDPSKDVAWWQHVNFSALSFGSDGVLDATNQKATLAAIVGGTQSWPDMTNPWNPTHPLGNGVGAVAVDDLWHATVMGRGSFVYAKSPIEVSYGLANILAGIQNQRTSRVGGALGGNVLDAANNVTYQATIEPGWAGDLLKIEINPTTGAFVKTWWNATQELAKQIEIPPATPTAQPWMLEANRRIVTLAKPQTVGTTILGPGVPFQYASLFAAGATGQAMLNSLAPASDTEQQKKIIAYLRGGSTFGPPYTALPHKTIEGTGVGQFRLRPSAGQDAVTYAPLTVQLGAGLGDISNAQPVIVAKPGRIYKDATDPAYSAYKALKSGRSTLVVAPANDGMVHVFNAGPTNPIAAGGGTELFAYMPRALFRGVAGAAATEDTTGIQALTYQDGGVPIYHHHMYVDSSPRVADIDFANGIGSSALTWRTIAVGGLGKGGNSYYALDLTDDAVPDETEAAKRVLWEWVNPDADVGPGGKLISGGSPGFTYGRPVIVKVRESGYPYGRWVVIVTGGYNNLSGKGKIYFLDATNGKLLSTITTSPPQPLAGTASNPSGLAQIHGFVRNSSDQTVEQIYGGDLFGNVWRVDVSARSVPTSAPDYAANVYNGVGILAPTTVLFAQLTDPSGVPQPITTAPQIEIDLNNGIDRYVFFGTGRLLHSDDLTLPAIPQQQTFYAIRDGTLTTVQTAGLPIQPRAPGMLASVATASLGAIAGGAPNGWYQDLPNDPATAEGAQRIVQDPDANANIASWIGTKIQDDPCLISLPAYLYARDYTSARSLILDSAGSLVPYIYFSTGLTGAPISGLTQADGSITLGTPANLPVGGASIITPVNFVNPISGPGVRWSWRLLSGQ